VSYQTQHPDSKFPKPLGTTSRPTTFKVLIAGPSNVGKTCLAHYFTYGKPNLDQSPTHGGKYTKTVWHLDQKDISVEICDTQGAKVSGQMLAPYSHYVDALIMVFDLNDLTTLKELEARFTMIMQTFHGHDNPVVFILGNKVDSLTGERPEGFISNLHILLQSIKTKMLEEYCKEGQIPPFLSYYEVSAKNGDNCREVWQQLELQVAYRKVFGNSTTPRSSLPTPKSGTQGRCC